MRQYAIGPGMIAGPNAKLRLWHNLGLEFTV